MPSPIRERSTWPPGEPETDRKSTRLNSSHSVIATPNVKLFAKSQQYVVLPVASGDVPLVHLSHGDVPAGTVLYVSAKVKTDPEKSQIAPPGQDHTTKVQHPPRGNEK